MKKIVLLLAIFISGCSALSSSDGRNARTEPSALSSSSETQKDKTRQEALKFFSEYPYYLYSANKENELYAEFMKIIKTNKNISIYDALMLAHRNLQHSD